MRLQLQNKWKKYDNRKCERNEKIGKTGKRNDMRENQRKRGKTNKTTRKIYEKVA